MIQLVCSKLVNVVHYRDECPEQFSIWPVDDSKKKLLDIYLPYMVFGILRDVPIVCPIESSLARSVSLYDKNNDSGKSVNNNVISINITDVTFITLVFISTHSQMYVIFHIFHYNCFRRFEYPNTTFRLSNWRTL